MLALRDISGDAIVQWAGRIEAFSTLPALVQRLLLASAPLHSLSMPADGGVRLRGWDGVVTSNKEGPFWPAGPSVWELSVDEKVQSKLNRDFDKRLQQAQGSIDVPRTTYVALTARRFGQENKAAAEEYVWGREFVDLVREFPGAVTEPQQLFNVLQRLTPRMYSIASSQAAHPREVHTTVRVIKYHAHGMDREGVCSGHLGERAPVGGTMPIFLHENNAFRLPADPETPVIMIGPGTGVAPFRAFLEERQATGQKGPMWLIFGEQRRVSDFLYEEQFNGMLADGTLARLDTAFSRDQGKKVYVQDRMQENAAELYDWLERGACFYVCGDASRMAKDVEQALLDVIAKGANSTLDHAQEYLQAMKKAKRYQRDVY